MLDPDDLGKQRDDLAETLRSLRKQAGLTGDRLAIRCGISQSKISRIETGKVLPSLADVESILQALHAPSDLIDQVSTLARLANTEFQDLRSSLRRGLHHKQRELASLEESSSEIRYFLPTMITGLLQTPEYLRAALSFTPGDHAKVITHKLERQAILYEAGKSFTFLLTEAAVRWRLCPPLVMASQMDRLVSVSRLPNVRLGVIALDAQLPGGLLNTFTVYDDRLATVDTFSGAIIMRDPRDVEFHLGVFARFEQHAYFGDDAREHLIHYAQIFRTSHESMNP